MLFYHLVKIVIFGAILLMIVKIIRWIEILITHRVSILYMILYLRGITAKDFTKKIAITKGEIKSPDKIL